MYRVAPRTTRRKNLGTGFRVTFRPVGTFNRSHRSHVSDKLPNLQTRELEPRHRGTWQSFRDRLKQSFVRTAVLKGPGRQGRTCSGSLTRGSVTSRALRAIQARSRLRVLRSR